MGHGFTGVAREYRGQGLTLAIKVAVLNRARSVGAATISTANDSANHRMLAVNHKLGFVPMPGTYLLRRVIAGC